jgi:hypothetical protein
MASPELNPPPGAMTSDVVEFRTRSIMPDEDVDFLWTHRTGFLESALASALGDIYARLRKRYRVPMAPVPEVVLSWQTKLVTPEAYRARGYNPNDPTLEGAEKDRERVYEQIKEAADAENGLFDLPLLDTEDASAVAKGGPLMIADASPYDWIDRQAEGRSYVRR